MYFRWWLIDTTWKLMKLLESHYMYFVITSYATIMNFIKNLK